MDNVIFMLCAPKKKLVSGKLFWGVWPEQKQINKICPHLPESEGRYLAYDDE